MIGPCEKQKHYYNIITFNPQHGQTVLICMLQVFVSDSKVNLNRTWLFTYYHYYLSLSISMHKKCKKRGCLILRPWWPVLALHWVHSHPNKKKTYKAGWALDVLFSFESSNIKQCKGLLLFSCLKWWNFLSFFLLQSASRMCHTLKWRVDGQFEFFSIGS